MPPALVLLTPPFFLEKGAGENEANNVKEKDGATQKAKKQKRRSKKTQAFARVFID